MQPEALVEVHMMGMAQKLCRSVIVQAPNRFVRAWPQCYFASVQAWCHSARGWAQLRRNVAMEAGAMQKKLPQLQAPAPARVEPGKMRGG